jgi:hypothetical protein
MAAFAGGAGRQTHGCIVSSGKMTHHLGDSTCVGRFVTGGGAHQFGEGPDRRLVRRAGLGDRHRRASPVGAPGSRMVTFYPERSDFLGETTGEPGDGPLRRLVGRQARGGEADTERGDLEM